MYYQSLNYPNWYVNVPIHYFQKHPIYWGYPQAINLGNLYQPISIGDRTENIGFNEKGKQSFVVNTAEEDGNSANPTYFGRTPDGWIQYTEFLVKEGLEDVKRGINATHILQEFILMGVLVGKGYSPEKAYETVEEWERTGESKLLQQSKNM